MKRLLGVLAMMCMISLTANLLSADDKYEVDPEAIKKAMKAAMKEGLLKKVAKGEGTKEEAQHLLDLFKAMAKVEPPKGEHKDFEKRVKVLIDAAQAAVEGKEGAGDLLTKAADCKGCHTAHRPPAN